MAELGDKSQLMALTFAARYRAVPVLIGITIATALVHAFSVVVGVIVGVALPTRAINAVAALAFFAFAAWTLRGDKLSDDEADRVNRSTRSPIIAASIAFFLAELGDKTMLATITLASTNGMVGADALAIAVGHQLGTRVSERVIKIGAAVLFAIFGVLLGIEAIRG